MSQFSGSVQNFPLQSAILANSAATEDAAERLDRRLHQSDAVVAMVLWSVGEHQYKAIEKLQRGDAAGAVQHLMAATDQIAGIAMKLEAADEPAADTQMETTDV